MSQKVDNWPVTTTCSSTNGSLGPTRTWTSVATASRPETLCFSCSNRFTRSPRWPSRETATSGRFIVAITWVILRPTGQSQYAASAPNYHQPPPHIGTYRTRVMLGVNQDLSSVDTAPITMTDRTSLQFAQCASGSTSRRPSWLGLERCRLSQPPGTSGEVAFLFGSS